MNKVIDMSEINKMRYFIKSLSQKMASRVNDLMPNSLANAKEIAVRINAYNPETKKNLCNYCMQDWKPGHKCINKMKQYNWTKQAI